MFVKSKGAIGNANLMFKNAAAAIGACDYTNGGGAVSAVEAEARASVDFAGCVTFRSASFSCEFKNESYAAVAKAKDAEDKAQKEEDKKAKRAVTAALWGGGAGVLVGAGTGVALGLAKGKEGAVGKTIAANVTAGTTIGLATGVGVGFKASGSEEYDAAGTAVLAGAGGGMLAAAGTHILASTGKGVNAPKPEAVANAGASISGMLLALPHGIFDPANDSNGAAGCAGLVNGFKSMMESEKPNVDAYVKSAYRQEGVAYPTTFMPQSGDKEGSDGAVKECWATYNSVGMYAISDGNDKKGLCVDRAKYGAGSVIAEWLVEKRDAGVGCRSLVGYLEKKQEVPAVRSVDAGTAVTTGIPEGARAPDLQLE